MKKNVLTPQLNIKFIGKVEIKGETVKGEPPTNINTANGEITLPDADTQHKGFYHERANELIRLFPYFYKPITPKG